MLILSRKSKQSIVIGEDIKVTVLQINGGNVRLGIAAPKSIKVDRQEIYMRRKAEKRSLKTIDGWVTKQFGLSDYRIKKCK